MAHQEYTEQPATVERKFDISFYAAWIILTTLCFPLAFLLSLIVDRIISIFVGDFIVVNGVEHITEDYIGIYIIPPLAGLITGVCQYFLLRSYLPRMVAWVWATLGGWLLGLLLIAIPGWLHWVVAPVNFYLALPLLGFGIGLAQWLVLRKYFRWAGLWIVANLIGWALPALLTDGAALDQIGLFSLGFIPACATAAMLWWLMRLKRVEEEQVKG